MTIYAEAECATCYAIRPKNEMREVVVRRVTGESYGHGSASSTSSSNSTSYGGSRPARMGSGQGRSTRRHSNKRVHMARERLWVCQGCKAPKSDWSPAMMQGLLLALGAGFTLVFSLTGGVPEEGKAPGAAVEAEPVQPMGASVPSGEEVIEAPANPEVSPDLVGSDSGAALLSEEEEASPAPAPSLPLAEEQMDRTSEIAAPAVLAEAEAEAQRARQAEALAAAKRRHCGNVTPEGRAMPDYMAMIGC